MELSALLMNLSYRKTTTSLRGGYSSAPLTKCAYQPILITMDIDALPPFLTGAEAGKLLGYSEKSTYISRLCRNESTRPPGAYQAGRTWMIPREWVIARRAKEEQNGITRTGRTGRPVTTGAGLMRKDRGGPGGRPRKICP